LNAPGELIELAGDIAQIMERAHAFDAELEALRAAAESVGKAWSGSNLGHHSRVYYRDYVAPPPYAAFNSQWGLENAWPEYEPDGGWEEIDFDAVVAEVVHRAGSNEPRKIESSLAPFRRAFSESRDRLLSILSVYLKTTKDDFLSKRVSDIESLEAPDPHVTGLRLLPRGAVITSDTRALSAGRIVAPHQSMLALVYSADITLASLSELERIARLVASHIQRLAGKSVGIQTGGMITFIGHGRSPIWRELKDFLKDELGLNVSEFNSVSAAGVTTMERLHEMLNSAQFAFLVMTGEDEAEGEVRARQNVVHEVGLFQGRLGFGKAIVLLEEGCSDFSNIRGLGVIPFPKGKIRAGFEDVRSVLRREKVI